MSAFLAEDNLCGQFWLQLVSKGNAIIAELMRLKDHIPSVYKLDNREDQMKYGSLLQDFRYFQRRATEQIERPDDIKRNVEFKENHENFLNRFAKILENVFLFAQDLKLNIEVLDKGGFIHYTTLESIFADDDGKQLLCEALYLFGVMMMVVDKHFPGLIRERLLVSYIRYSTKMARGNRIEEVCELFRSRGPNDTLMTKYFGRFVMPKLYVGKVIAHLKYDDIYNQMSAYPNPDEETTALSSQAAMLYVCLYFAPKSLCEDESLMRSIVQKFFHDNWVISVHMGLTVNLAESWEPYAAARIAMANTLSPKNVKKIVQYHVDHSSCLESKCKEYLSEGKVTKHNILDLIGVLTKLIRDSNVTLRWLLLHTAHKYGASENNKKYKQILENALPMNKQYFVFVLLMSTGELEMHVKDLVQTLLTEKSYNWDIWKEECIIRLVELAEIFLGTKIVFGVKKKTPLSKWLLEIKSKVSELSMEHVSTASVAHLIQAMDKSKDYYQMGEHAQINQLFIEIMAYLQKMIQAAQIKEEDLINLQKVGDLSYAWELIKEYTPEIQRNISLQPRLVSILRNTFLKLSSAVEIPLLRITTSKSSDFTFVTNYYYNELVLYVGKVLQVIPEKMFKLVLEIVSLQTNELRELPIRLDKDKLKDMAQLDQRMKIAKLTHQVSVLSEGVLQMKSTLVGVIRIDPKQLLEDGIRKELVKKIGEALNDGLVIIPRKGDEVSRKLQDLAQIMSGYERSFEYIQDYIGIQGRRIWLEELARVLGFYMDLETNTLKRSKIQPWESEYYNKFIPVPYFKPIDKNSETCLGRLLREIIRITNPKETNYNTSTTTWYDVKKTKEGKLKINVDLSLFKMINAAIGVPGLMSLDNLLCFMITAELQSFFLLIKQSSEAESWQIFFSSAIKEMPPDENFAIENPNKVYAKWFSRTYDLSGSMLEKVLKIGQLQLLRVHIQLEIRISSHCNATKIHNAIENFNRALLTEERKLPEGSRDISKTMPEVTSFLKHCGIYNVQHQLFLTVKRVKYFAFINFLFVAGQFHKLRLNRDAGLMGANQLDGWPLVIGVHTVFRQVHKSLNEQFIKYIAQYTHSHLKAFTSSKAIEKETKLPHEVAISLTFLMQYCEMSGFSRVALEQYIPAVILNLYGSLISNSP